MSDYFVGEIRLFAGNYAPLNFLPCDGRTLSVSDNNALFALLGTTWGGDGVNTFAIPDLRGRVPVGQGTGTGLSAHTLGQTGGTETVTLTVANLPVHTHPWNTQASPATSNVPTNTLLAQQPAQTVGYVPQAKDPTAFAFASTMVEIAGENQPHDNIMPSIALSYIICIFGLYPTRP